MAILNFPEFTRDSDEFWAAIPMQYREQILSNVFCSRCREAVEIVDYSDAIIKGDLLLKGKCATCGHDVARLVEGS
ncbi:MAG: hypothetical protein HKK66_05835 [Chlorobiaceae bacterium]|nr:hypothetical protein [Chlorobiaceae bacterium]